MHKYIGFIGFMVGLVTKLSAQTLDENYVARYFAQRTGQTSQRGILRYDFLLLENTPRWSSVIIRENLLRDPYQLISVGTTRAGVYRNTLLAYNVSGWGEQNARLQVAINLGKLSNNKISHYFSNQTWVEGYWLGNRVDMNRDSFLDLPIKNRWHVFTDFQWTIEKKKGDAITSRAVNNFKFEYFNINEQGGTLNFREPQHYLTTLQYGTGSQTRWAQAAWNNQTAFGKSRKAGQLPFKRTFQLWGDYIQQQNYWGTRLYKAKEYSVESFVNYAFPITPLSSATLGLQAWYQHIEESLDTMQRPREQLAANLSFNYLNQLRKRWVFQSRSYLGYHNSLGIFPIVTAQLNYKPNQWLSTQIFAGNNARMPNGLSEFRSYFNSNRQVFMDSLLKPEYNVYGGLGAEYAQYFYLLGSNVSLTGRAQWTYTHYWNLVTANLDRNPYSIYIYNTPNGSYKHSLDATISINANYGRSQFSNTSTYFNLSLFYRYDQPRTNIDGALRLPVFYSQHAFGVENWWDVALKLSRYNIIPFFRMHNTFLWASRQRLPDVSAKDSSFYKSYSPTLFCWNISFVFPLHYWLNSSPRKKYFQGLRLHFSIDNLTNNTQKIAVIHPNNPFNPNFDAGMQWGSTVGRRFWFGLQWQLR